MTRVLTFVVLLTLGSPAAAHACSCVGITQTTAAERRLDLSRQVAGSEAVFLGQVTALNAGWTEFRVVRVWKGSLGSSAVLSTGREPETGGLIVWNSCTRSFGDTIGDSFIVFANGSPPGLLTASKCGPTVRWEDAAETELFLNDFVLPQAPQPIDPWFRARADVLAELLDAVDTRRRPLIVAGANLDPVSRAALDAWLASPRRPQPRGYRPLLRSRQIVIETVSGSTNEARVFVTLGAVPETPRTSCGISMLVPVKRAGSGWSVAMDESSANCANVGVPPFMLAARLADVREREVLLLVLSHLEIGNDLAIVADPSLPESARKVLSDLGPVLHAHQVGTERFELPPKHLLVKTLQLQAETAFVEVTLGPVPRHATLACGTGYRVKLLAAGRGWRIGETTVIEC